MSDPGQSGKPLGGDGGLSAASPKPRGRGARRARGLAIECADGAIRRWRYRAFLTQTELAERAGISKSYLCELEKGRYWPGIDVLRDIARALGCEITDLMADQPDGNAA